MNTKYYLYKTSPRYPSETCRTVMLAENESLDAILDGAMIWALGIHEIGEKDDFDYPGALKDHGNFV